MKKLVWSCLMFFSFFSGLSQTRVILDADIDSDVDDVAALAMLHKLAAGKQIELAGVIVTSDDPYAPLCVDAVNTYFGKSNIPVAFLKTQPALVNHSKYTRQISEEFPHRLRSYKDAHEAVDLYRELLSKSTDNSVVIVTIGHLSSLQQLLQSAPDRYAPVGGKELALKKVSRWICMGGMFPEGKEANFSRPDMQSTIYCLQQWSNPVVFCGWEIGKGIITGGPDLKKELKPQSPVYRAFQLYNNFSGRPSWDQSAVLLLVNANEQFFQVVSNGYCLIEGDGSNRWIPGVRSRQSYVRLKEGVDPGVLAALVNNMLVDK